MRRAWLTALLASLALIAAAPASARVSSIPRCNRFGGAAVTSVLGTGPLLLQKTIGNLCSYRGVRPGHYDPLFAIQLVPWSRALFALAEAHAMGSAAAEHAAFGHVSRSLKVGTQAFDVYYVNNGNSLEPCEGVTPMPPLGPGCRGEPASTAVNVVARGPLKRGGSDVMVSLSEVAQSGDVSLSHVLALAARIFAGQIH